MAAGVAPSEFCFLFSPLLGLDVENYRSCLEDFKWLTGRVVWPHLPLHQQPPSPVHQHTEGYYFTSMFGKLWPKINLHLKVEEGKPERHNRTACDSVYLYRKKCDIDLYGENIVHWNYRMMFVFRVRASNVVRWLEANHWVFSWVHQRTTDTASLCFVKIILLVLFYFYTDHSSRLCQLFPSKRFKKQQM